MDDQTLLEYSKDLTLNFLKKIGATVDDSYGLYTVTFPINYESIFGSITKRITFEHSVADTHSCEWVVPGSNFLGIILGEIKKQAPVIGGHIKKQIQSPDECLNKISTHDCSVVLDSFTEKMKIAIRFYFNITVKSIRSISMLRWIDIDLETMRPLEFPSEIQLDLTLGTIRYERRDPRIDYCYSKATEVLKNEIESLAMKYVTKTQDSLTQDLNSLNQVHARRLKEINEDVSYQKSKLKEFDRKIIGARYVDTQMKYVAEKEKQSERIKKSEEKAIAQIERLTKDKESQIQQIEKRHRPIIDFSLIAGTAYSYSTSKCKILLKNQFTEKETNLEFLEPSQEFTLICEVCNRKAEKSHLCVNSHVVCDFCVRHCIKCQKDACIQCSGILNPCYICKEVLCPDCSTNCNFCEDLICEKHLIKCSHCSEIACFFCSDDCQYCAKKFCSKSITSCHICDQRICTKDSKSCLQCNNQFCPNDRNVCAICDGIHCMSDSGKCQFCEQTYSKNCMSNNLCKSCFNLNEVNKENITVQQIIATYSDLNKYKKWEISENNRYCIYKAKKMLGSKIIVYDKNLRKIIVDKKGGWI